MFSAVKNISLSILLCISASANTYYVANAGNDSNSGTSSSAPWKTLAHVNSVALSAGDYVLLNRGDVWREQLSPASSGSSGSQITISAYGAGANPVVSGANLITQWTGSGSSTSTACGSPCIFSSGMETSGFTDWSQVYLPATDGTSISQTSAVANTGTFSAQLKGTGIDNRAGLTQTFPALGAEGVLYFRFYIYVPYGALKPSDYFTIFQVPARGSNISLGTDGAGNVNSLQFYSTGGSVVPLQSIAFNMGAWNYFDVAFKIGASDGGGQVWLNGANLGGNYSLNTLNSAGVSSVTVGNDSFGHGQVAGGSIYLDDFEIATAGPIGPGGSSSSTSSSGVWSSPLPSAPNVVFIAGNLGTQTYSVGSLNAAGQWYWNNGTLYVYSASGTPANVEAGQRDYALLLGQTGGGSYMTISGIDFRIANEDVAHIVNTTGVTLSGNLISGAYQYGLLAFGYNGTVSNLLVSGNTVSMNGSSGIEISAGHSYVTVQNNVVFGNAYNPSYTGDYIEMGGIKFYSTQGAPNYDLVQYNISDHNGVLGGNESQGSGIWFDTISGSTMQYNVSFNNAAFGLYFEKTANCSLLSNVAYSNAAAANTSNIAAYASQGLPSFGNVVANNTAWNSLNWGMKVGAYQGAGATQVFNNTYENNLIVNSQSLNLFADTGADNDYVNGYGNVYSSNAFGHPTSEWIFWVNYGFVTSYSQLDAAYGSPMNNNQSGWSVPVGGQQSCGGSCIFSSGIENLSDWSGIYQPASDGTTVTQTSGVANSGTYALKLTGGGQDNRGGLNKSFPAIGAGGTLYFRFYIDIPGGAVKSNDQFQIFQIPAAGVNVTLGTDGNGSVNTMQLNSNAGAIVGTTQVTFPMGRWNYVDVAYRVGSGNGGGQLWLNGASVGGTYSLNTSGAAGASSLILGNASNGHGQVASGNIYFDDFEIANAGPISAAPVAMPVTGP